MHYAISLTVLIFITMNGISFPDIKRPVFQFLHTFKLTKSLKLLNSLPKFT